MIPGSVPTVSESGSMPAADAFLTDVLAGLAAPHKTIPPKYFYDAHGSELFTRITELDEYYPTRTELAIMRRDIGPMVDAIGPGCLLIELGSGTSQKTRLLLDQIVDPAGYVPIDISRETLIEAAAALRSSYPGLDVLPVWADYQQPFTIPVPAKQARRRVVYFPGSTIGNMHPAEARSFLRSLANLAGLGGGLLIGVDLKKDRPTLERAYNDAAGVTAAFNLNLLVRINRELGADFVVDQFRHWACYDESLGRIEMHLVSERDQRVQLAGRSFDFFAGESILTECSYKYRVAEFATLAADAGFMLDAAWVDPDQQFSVQYLTVSG